MRAALAATDLMRVGWRTPNNMRSLRLAVRPPLTQRELAERLACTQQEVAAWETGARIPTLARALAIAVVLGTTVEAVFFDTAAMAALVPAERPSDAEMSDASEHAAQRETRAGPSHRAPRETAPSKGEALSSL